MITKERIGLHLPRIGLIAIIVLAMTALPAWSKSKKEKSTEKLAKGAVESTSEKPAACGDTLAISPDGRTLHYRATRVGSLLLQTESREAALRQELIATLQKLRDQAAAAGRTQEAAAIDARVAALQAENGANLTAYRGRNGQVLCLTVIGGTTGSVWGGSDGVYTDDSNLGAAAVHAGVLQSRQSGTVTVEILPGRDSYTGCERNGVTTNPYGAWHGSFRFVRPAGDLGGGAANVPAAANALAGTRGQADKGKLVLVLIEVIGATTGAVWGDGVYTDDSSVAAAAVHAGLIRPDQRATVVMQVLPGRDSYLGSTRNGVISSSYGAWGGSFQLLGCVEHGANVGVETRIRRLGASLHDVETLGARGL